MYTLVSVRRVVPSSDVTMDTWEVGVPGSSSTVTVSSSTSGASGIMAKEAWLPGLCSWARGQVLVGGPRAQQPWGKEARAGLDARRAFFPCPRACLSPGW